MFSARADISEKYSIIGTIYVVPMILFVCLLILGGCKKDAAQDSSANSVMPAPTDVSPAEAQATLPSGAMKGLSVAVPDTEARPAKLPDMKLISGTDMSVRISQRMADTPGWTQDFAAFYKPVSDCLEEIDGGGASVASVTANAGQVTVIIAGLDGAWQECTIAAIGGQASITPTNEKLYSGPVFFPRDAGKPVINQPQCIELESVVARPGGLIGWLGFQKLNCP